MLLDSWLLFVIRPGYPVLINVGVMCVHALRNVPWEPGASDEGRGGACSVCKIAR